MPNIVCGATTKLAVESAERILQIVFGTGRVKCFTITSNVPFNNWLGVHQGNTVGISGIYVQDGRPERKFDAVMTMGREPLCIVSGKHWCQTIEFWEAGERTAWYFAKYNENTNEFEIHEYGDPRGINWVGRSASERHVEPTISDAIDCFCFMI